MPSNQRHNRLSQLPGARQPALRRRQPPKQRAKSLEEFLAQLEAAESVEKRQMTAESQQLSQYFAMALRHLPEPSILTDAPEDVFRKYMATVGLATFFRSACTSKNEIQAIVVQVLEGMKNSSLEAHEKAELEGYIVDYYQGAYGSVVTETLGDFEFKGTKDLKRVFLDVWSKDPHFKCYKKLDWTRDVLKTRQRIGEKLNGMIYELFASRRGKKSKYVEALTKASQKVQAKMIVCQELPLDYEIENTFGNEVCKMLDVWQILKKWTGNYNREPERRLKFIFPLMLTSRAVKKNKQAISDVAHDLIKLIKQNRKQDRLSEEDEESDFSFSQPSLRLSQIAASPPISQKRFQNEIQAMCDLTLPSSDEESTSDLLSTLEKQVPGFHRSMTNSKNTPTPTFSAKAPLPKPKLNKKRTASGDRPSKKPKTSDVNILDGLPPLEKC